MKYRFNAMVTPVKTHKGLPFDVLVIHEITHTEWKFADSPCSHEISWRSDLQYASVDKEELVLTKKTYHPLTLADLTSGGWIQRITSLYFSKLVFIRWNTHLHQPIQ